MTAKPMRLKKTTQKFTKPTKTYVAIVLDRSGSMEIIRDQAISLFNEQIATIKRSAQGQDARVTLVTFSDVVDSAIFLHERPSYLKPISRSTYIPHGCTALNDAIGDTIFELRNVADKDNENVSFLVLIITDGQENNSKRFNHREIKSQIQELETTGRWTFTYLGCSRESLEYAVQNLGISYANVGQYIPTPDGMRSASMGMGRGTACYFAARADGYTATNNFMQSAGLNTTADQNPLWTATKSTTNDDTDSKNTK